MANELTAEERIRLIIETFGADQVVKEFKKVKLEIQGISDLNKKLGIKQAGGVEVFRNQLEIAAATKKASLAAGRFRMEYLGVMFAGMAMQRVFGGMFKGLIDNYKKLSAKSNPLNIALTRLEANFTFLKYSIMEAAAGPFELLVNGIANFALWLAKVDPKWLEGIAIGIATIAAVGTVFYIGGQFMIGLQAFLKTLEGIGSGSVSTGLLRVAGALGALGAISVGMYLTWDLLTKPDDAKSRLLSMLGITASGAVAGGLIGAMVGGPLGIIPGAGLGAVIGFTIAFAAGLADTFLEEGATKADFFSALKKNLPIILGGAAFTLISGPAGLVIMMGGLIKTVFDMSVELDKKQKLAVSENYDIIKREYDKIVEWAEDAQERALKQGKVMSMEELLARRMGHYDDFSVGGEFSMGELFGGDFSALQGYVTQMEGEIAAANERMAASAITANNTTTNLALDNASKVEAAQTSVWTNSSEQAVVSVAEFLKNDTSGGQALLNLAADLDADFNKAFRDRTMTIKIKYEEEDKPSGIGGFDDVNSGSTF